MSNMVATGQEMVREKIPQGQGKVREFHFKSNKEERSRGKVKF